jgi:hypothetical protein
MLGFGGRAAEQEQIDAVQRSPMFQERMKQGEEAVKKLAEMDSSMGLQDPVDVARRLRGDKNKAPVQPSGDALGDQALANNLRQQAERMSREAKGLLAEAARLEKEAATLDPVKAEVTKPKKTKKTKVDA